jgi:LAO/AO transport system kinase
VLLCVQPASGDSLQFMKAGVTELPDVIAVTKADLGEVAQRTRADVAGALSLEARGEKRPVLAIATARAEDLDALEAALADHRAWLAQDDRLAIRRRAQQQAWIAQATRARFGSAGLEAAHQMTQGEHGPFATEHAIARELQRRLRG